LSETLISKISKYKLVSLVTGEDPIPESDPVLHNQKKKYRILKSKFFF